MWITSTDLVEFAKRIQSHNIIPEYVYKLIIATAEKNSIVKIHFAVGDDIQIGGLDGDLMVKKDEGTIFIPDGYSVWESGQGNSSQIKTKADEDYKKRTEKPLGYNPHDSTFIFFTACKYKKKKEWEAEKLKEGKWKDVRFYDALDLEKWFHEASGVSCEFAKEGVGKFPKTVKSLHRNWQEWCITRSHRLDHSISLRNRNDQYNYVLQWLQGNITDPEKSGRLIIKANSVEEAICFFASVIETLNEQTKSVYYSKSIIVSDKDEFDLVVNKKAEHIIINNTNHYCATNYAVYKNHKVIIPILKNDTDLISDIELDNLTEDALTDELLRLGFNINICLELFKISSGDLFKLKKALV